MYFCDNCNQHHSSQESFHKHYTLGCDNFTTKINLPTEGDDDFIVFKNYQNQIEKPFVMYCDAEAFTTFEKHDDTKNTFCYQHHKDSAFCYMLVDRVENKSELKVFDNKLDYLKGIIKVAIEKCTLMKKSCDEECEEYHPIKMTKSDKERHKCSTHCSLCKNEFNENE